MTEIIFVFLLNLSLPQSKTIFQNVKYTQVEVVELVEGFPHVPSQTNGFIEN
jgi:hypothetical protein